MRICRIPHSSVIRHGVKRAWYKLKFQLWMNVFSKFMSHRLWHIDKCPIFLSKEIEEPFKDQIQNILMMAKIFDYDIRIDCYWGGNDKWFGRWLSITLQKDNKVFILQMMLDNVRRILRKTNLRVFTDYALHEVYDVYSEDTNINEPLKHLMEKM